PRGRGGGPPGGGWAGGRGVAAAQERSHEEQRVAGPAAGRGRRVRGTAVGLALRPDQGRRQPPVRRRGMWIGWSGGVLAAVVAAFFFAGSAIIRRTTDDPKRAHTVSAEARARELTALRSDLAAAVRFVPAPGTRDMAVAAPVV